jgi:hypothetical protein
MNETELLKRIAELPRDMAPDNDPWAKISARIEPPQSTGASWTSSRQWMLGVAASAVIAVTAGLMFGPGWIGGTDSRQATVERAVAAGTPAVGGYAGVIAASEAEYRAAFREFISVGDSRSSLPALTIEKSETGWADLQSTETALAAALEAEPDDPFLNGRMLELRARQLGFLKQLATLDHSNRRMTI